MKNKEKKIWRGLIAVLVLVILFMSFSMNFNVFSGRGTEQLMKMQIVQILAQENVLSVDATTAMNMIGQDELIVSCASDGVANYLISEGVIDEDSKYAVVSSLIGEFDKIMNFQLQGRREKSCASVA